MEHTPDRASSQKDIMSVCLAVVRGFLTPDQARAAILGRTAPVPVSESLRLSPEIISQAEGLERLEDAEKEECLAIFKELYEQAPPDEIQKKDQDLAQGLVDQRLLSAQQAKECLAIQTRLAGAKVHPLPRLGELLVQKGYLVPGLRDEAPTVRLSDRPRSEALTERVRQDLHHGLPAIVREYLVDPQRRFGRYVRVELLGRGGAGEVWKGWDLELGRWVALKFLKFEDVEELARLKREAQTAAKLSHPNIAGVFEIAEARERTFLVLEYIEGQTLETFPRDNPRKLVSVVMDVALALDYAHTRGVIHRDIKPGNIMVDSSGRPFVMDFGLARQVESNLSVSGTVLGTPAYMPPEQATGERADARSDVYSIGATLYELVADRPPFRGESLLEILRKVTHEDPDPVRNIAPELGTIISKCLIKEPSRRYATAGELAEDLRRFQEGEPILAHPPSFAYRLKKKIAKRRAVLSVALGGLLLAAGVAVLLVPRWLQKDRELRAEREKEARAKQALDQARPFLDDGRKIMERLDRVQMLDQPSMESVETLARNAQRQFDLALAASPGFPDALLEKARAYQTQGKSDLALDYCARAIEASPQYGTAYLQRARILLDRYERLRHASGQRLSPETGEEKELARRVREDLREVEAWSRDNQEILFARGALAFVNGDFGEAGRFLQAYSELVISDQRGWRWAGHAWLHIPGKEDEAIRSLSEAMKFRPRVALIYVFRGFAYLRKAKTLRRQGDLRASFERSDEAARDFTKALGLDPATQEAHLGLGDVRSERGDAAGAFLEYGEAVRINPDFGVAYLRRASLCLRNGDLESGLAEAQEAIRVNPEDPRGLLARAALLGAGAHFEGAQADIEAALKLAPATPEALLARGQLKELRGDLGGALEDYASAIQLKPDLAEAYHRRGVCLGRRGDLKGALVEFSRAQDLDQGNPGIYYSRAVAQIGGQDREAAASDLRRGLEWAPSNRAKYYLRLWQIEAREGRREKGQEDLEAWLGLLRGNEPTGLYPSIARFLLGQISEDSFQNTLETGSWLKTELAAGWYYLAQKAFQDGRKPAALQGLKNCLETGAVLCDEYQSAQEELTHPRSDK